MTETELAQTLREGLSRQAAQMDVDRGVVERARAEVRRRRRVGAVLGAVAAVVVLVAGAAVVGVARDRGTRSLDEVPAAPIAKDSARVDCPDCSGFRTEYWRGVRVDVPADWGWGPTPQACGTPGPGPYVGRPILQTDACSLTDPDAVPDAPYLWFDAQIPEGTVDLGAGWTRESVDLGGTLVSVATHDAGLREAILATLAPGEVCQPERADVPVPRSETTREGRGAFEGAALCAYRQDRGRYQLVWAQSLDERLYTSTRRAVVASRPAAQCDGPSYELVLVTARYHDPLGSSSLAEDVVYDLSCGRVSLAGPSGSGPARNVSEATVPWAGREFRHLLTGPRSGGSWVYERFIGVQG